MLKAITLVTLQAEKWSNISYILHTFDPCFLMKKSARCQLSSSKLEANIECKISGTSFEKKHVLTYNTTFIFIERSAVILNK